jgi:probable HAF family extracellular repeat protein
MSEGYGINDAGDVVGFSYISSDPTDHTQHAFIAAATSASSMADLNTLIDADDPLRPYVTLNWATAINNDGLILANGVDSRQGGGTDNGGGKMYLLTPVNPLVFLTKLALTFISALPNASTDQQVVLTNTGNASLQISSISVGGPNAQEFQETNDCGTTVAPKASCTLTITFIPDEEGDGKGDILITDNAPDSPQEIALGGSTAVPDYTLSTAPSQLSGNAGQTLTTSLSVTPVNGFSQPVTFSCSGLPAGGSCTFAPTSITPTIPAPATTTLTIQAPTTLSNSQEARAVAGMFGIPLLLSAGALGFGRKQRLARSSALLLMCSILLAGCGGSGSSSSPTAATTTTKTYNVVITATSGPGNTGSTVITHSLTLPLTLTQ